MSSKFTSAAREMVAIIQNPEQVALDFARTSSFAYGAAPPTATPASGSTSSSSGGGGGVVGPVRKLRNGLRQRDANWAGIQCRVYDNLLRSSPQKADDDMTGASLCVLMMHGYGANKENFDHLGPFLLSPAHAPKMIFITAGNTKIPNEIQQ